MQIRFTAAAMVVLALGCGATPKPLPKAPQIELFPTGLYFDTDLCLGTYIGTAPENTLQITNGGQEPLLLTSVVKTGDSHGVFAVNGPVLEADGGDQPATQLLSQQTAFVQVIFTPTAPLKYTASLTISSNAANSPSLVVPLRAVGVLPPVSNGDAGSSDLDGGAPLADGGITPDCIPDGG